MPVNPTNNHTPAQAPPQDIEQLRSRHTDLDRRRAAAEANLKTATEQLEALKSQARMQYGSDDLEALRSKLDTMKQDNERRRAEYQQHLDGIEKELAAVDAKYSDARTVAGGAGQA